MAAFTHQVQIEFAEKEREGVGVEWLEGGAGGESVLNAIAGCGGAVPLCFRESCFKETFGTKFGCFDHVLRISETDGGGDRAGMKHANDPAIAGRGFYLVRAEQRERIGVAADDECVDGGIEWRFWGTGRCDGRFFNALFGQVCVSPTCREASLGQQG